MQSIHISQFVSCPRSAPHGASRSSPSAALGRAGGTNAREAHGVGSDWSSLGETLQATCWDLTLYSQSDISRQKDMVTLGFKYQSQGSATALQNSCPFAPPPRNRSPRFQPGSLLPKAGWRGPASCYSPCATDHKGNGGAHRCVAPSPSKHCGLPQPFVPAQLTRPESHGTPGLCCWASTE